MGMQVNLASFAQPSTLLLALLIIVKGWRRLLKAITAFTLAHRRKRKGA
ncbi:MAG: hypothetical protein V3U42_04915 [candidate division NC10 bacterium]